MRRDRAQGTLCWECANAVPLENGSQGCPWSEDFVPVPGWVAERRDLAKFGAAGAESYFVHECPRFRVG